MNHSGSYHSRSWLTLATLALALSACAGANDDVGPHADAGADGDGWRTTDSGTDGDTGAEFDGGYPPQDDPSGLAYDSDGLGFMDSASTTTPAETSDCNAALRSVGALLLDCSDSACRHVASCCVGRGDCCGRAAGLAPGSPDWSMCVGDVDSCAGLAGTTFGSPRPTITLSGTLAPGGDGTFDSGLVLDSVVDLRSTRLTLTTTFARPTDCGAGCLEGAAVSLSTQDVFDDTTHVRVLAGLALSGSRDTVALVVNDREVQHWPVSDASAWTLVLSPDGTVDVTDGATSMLPEPVGYVPAAAARVVLSGHDQNPTPDHQVAGVRTIDISASRCDIPTRWSAHQDIALNVVSDPTVFEPDVDALSTALAGDGTLAAALLIDGSLYTAQRPADDDTRLILKQAPANPLLAPEADQAFGPPTLHFAPAFSGYVILLPVEVGGVTTLMRAEYDPGEDTLSTPIALLQPSADVIGFTNATVASSPGGGTALVVRRLHRDGSRDFASYRVSGTISSPEWLEGTRLNEALTSSAAAGFDADEIGGMALTGANHAWQLYYARRSGARWSIGLLVSDDLLYWRHAAGGESVLMGDASSHELVGVRSPAITIRNERVTLRYLGLDGSHAWPRVATRWATSNGVWPN